MNLDEWQRAVLPRLRECTTTPSPIRDATLLAYFFWDDERIYTKFYAVECAFLCAFRQWGVLPSVLVVNRTTEAICKFCSKHGVELQVDASLTGGVPAMNIDCIRNLHKRFKSDYVIIIQSDGIPVNAGIEGYLGKYDYVGAPWPGHCHYRDWFPYPRFGVGNGGFCIRSQRICRRAADAYDCFWRHLPYNWLVGDDVFYCKTMPFFSSYWRKTFKFPSIEEAIGFSIEHIPPGVPIEKPPVGFHSARGFEEYVRRFGLPLSDLLS